jgi:hypothetical protein
VQYPWRAHTFKQKKPGRVKGLAVYPARRTVRKAPKTDRMTAHRYSWHRTKSLNFLLMFFIVVVPPAWCVFAFRLLAVVTMCPMPVA